MNNEPKDGLCGSLVLLPAERGPSIACWLTCLLISQQFCFATSPHFCHHTWVLRTTKVWPASATTTLHTTEDSAGPESIIAFPGRTKDSYHWLAIKGLPGSRSISLPPAAPVCRQMPETKASSSGLHRGTLFWVIQRMTGSSQAFWI